LLTSRGFFIGATLFNPESTIIARIKAKNKSLIKSLKIKDITLEGDYVIFKRIDTTNGREQFIKYKHDSFYQLNYVESFDGKR
jgi:hypothetical protein